MIHSIISTLVLSCVAAKNLYFDVRVWKNKTRMISNVHPNLALVILGIFTEDEQREAQIRKEHFFIIIDMI